MGVPGIAVDQRRGPPRGAVPAPQQADHRRPRGGEAVLRAFIWLAARMKGPRSNSVSSRSSGRVLTTSSLRRNPYSNPMGIITPDEKKAANR